MGNDSQDEHEGFNRDEHNIFLDMLVEEFINKQPEAMDALVALVLTRISKITDEGWNRVSIRFTERTGKKYTMMELKEQFKRFTQRSQGTFDPYFERENDTTSPNENVSTPEKDATSCDGCNVNVSYPEDYVRNPNRSSGKVSSQEGPAMEFLRTASKQSFEPKNDSRISRSPNEKFSFLDKEGINSNESNFNVPCPEENVRNSDRSCDNLCYQDSGPGLDFPCATDEPYLEYYTHGGNFQSREVSYEDNGLGICRSPMEQFSTPEKEGIDSDGCNGDKGVGNSSRSCGNVFNQEGGPDTSFRGSEYETPDEHENDAPICLSPVGSVPIYEKNSCNSDGSNDGVSYCEESVRNFNRRCNAVLDPQEGVVDSRVNPNAPYPRECENEEDNVEDFRMSENATKNAGESKGRDGSTSDAENYCESSRKCENVSSPFDNVESSSNRFDSASGQEENATISTPRYEDHGTKQSMRQNKSPASDSLDSGDYKRNKWSSYSQEESTCGVDQNPDDGDSFSLARCRNILHGMRRIDNQFLDNALDFLENPFYRKFFIQMKHYKRLDWLKSILGM